MAAADFEAFLPELVAIRRRLHAMPELGLEEHATSESGGGSPEGMGLRRYAWQPGPALSARSAAATAGAAVGLRADMDALPMQEERQISPGRAERPGMDARLRP